MLEERAKLINYANTNMGRSFSWGFNDCNTCVLECLTMLYPEWGEVLTAVRGSYSSKTKAFKYYMTMNNTWEDELTSRGFTEVINAAYQPGDVFLIPYETHLVSSYICAGRDSISSSEELGTCLTNTLEVLRSEGVKKFRKTE